MADVNVQQWIHGTLDPPAADGSGGFVEFYFGLSEHQALNRVRCFNVIPNPFFRQSVPGIGTIQIDLSQVDMEFEITRIWTTALVGDNPLKPLYLQNVRIANVGSETGDYQLLVSETDN